MTPEGTNRITRATLVFSLYYFCNSFPQDHFFHIDEQIMREIKNDLFSIKKKAWYLKLCTILGWCRSIQILTVFADY